MWAFSLQLMLWMRRKNDKVGLLLEVRLIALDSPDNLKTTDGVSSIEEVFLKAEGE